MTMLLSSIEPWCDVDDDDDADDDDENDDDDDDDDADDDDENDDDDDDDDDDDGDNVLLWAVHFSLDAAFAADTFPCHRPYETRRFSASFCSRIITALPFIDRCM
jgi:hypothetical protein